MESIIVKDLMIPLAEYATVSEEASLYEAVFALETAQQNIKEGQDKHRAVLVLNNENKVIGKLSQLDILRGLEPKYDQIGNLRESSRYGFSAEFIRSMTHHYDLWRKPLDDICKKAANIKVVDIMYTPKDGEYVKADDTINHAIHQLVMGHHQSLLVTEAGGDIVGILKLSDVFKVICERMKACQI
jgi:CBS domain-containing protein